MRDTDDPQFAKLILGRPEQRIDVGAVSGCVLITGSAGYIGSAVCRHFGRHAVALDNSESALAALDADGLRVELADIRDPSAMDAVFARYRPDTVIHAAAYKHVPLLERFPFEAFATNSIGTKIVADAAEAHGTRRFVLLSTDKAADPVNILGFSKRVAELIVLSRGGSKTTFCAVRFGNVFGSTGSVAPIFARQIAEGGPVTVTDAAASRYFITPGEAVGVLIAISQSQQPGLFAYAPAPPLGIGELARRMIQTSSGNGAVKITFSGLRAGEKLSETLHGEGELAVSLAIDGLLRIDSPVPPPQEMESAVAAILTECRERQLEALTGTVRALVLASAPPTRLIPAVPRRF